MSKVIIGMGLPGSGKSTTLSQFAEAYGYEYMPLDEIRKNLGIGEGQASTEDVFNEITSRTLELHKEGKTVVLDGTFLNDMRKRLIAFVREKGVKKIQGLLIDTPEHVAWERMQVREAEWQDKTTRELFDDRVRHKKEFPPSVTDDFDTLFTLDENGRLSKVERAKEQNGEFRSRPFS